MKTKLILNDEYKKIPSAKNIWEIFVKLNFLIVLLAAPSKSHIEFSGRRDQVTAACLLAKQWNICVKWWEDTGFLFLLLFFFFQLL